MMTEHARTYELEGGYSLQLTLGDEGIVADLITEGEVVASYYRWTAEMVPKDEGYRTARAEAMNDEIRATPQRLRDSAFTWHPGEPPETDG